MIRRTRPDGSKSAEMRVVDAQIHVVEDTLGSWTDPPQEGFTVVQRTTPGFERHARVTLHDMLREMDRAGVDGVVLVPWMPVGHVGPPNNTTCVDAARLYPERFRVIGRIDLEDPKTVDVMQSWQDTPEILGVRVAVESARGNMRFTAPGALEWLWETVAAQNLSVLVHSTNGVKWLQDVLEHHPEINFALDHLGIGSDKIVGEILPMLGDVLSLAAFPNMAVKATALPSRIAEDYPFPTLKRSLKVVIDTYGADRVFWGSDLSHLSIPYEKLLAFFADELDFLSDTEMSKVLGAGIQQWIGWYP